MGDVNQARLSVGPAMILGGFAHLYLRLRSRKVRWLRLKFLWDLCIWSNLHDPNAITKPTNLLQFDGFRNSRWRHLFWSGLHQRLFKGPIFCVGMVGSGPICCWSCWSRIYGCVQIIEVSWLGPWTLINLMCIRMNIFACTGQVWTKMPVKN